MRLGRLFPGEFKRGRGDLILVVALKSILAQLLARTSDALILTSATPWTRCDREADYRQAWAEFERRLGKKGVI